MFLLSNFILKSAFGKRCDGNPNLKYFTAEDFEGLNLKPISFVSNEGQTLRGNIYTHQSVKEYKGIIVFVHGMGGGHISYTTEINTFAKAGFIVIGYDNTGTFSSDGDNIKGFFQAVIDLKYALKYINENEELNKYGVALVGHSWGAYSVCQELQYNPKVKAVVAFSGFNNSSEILCVAAKKETNINFNFLNPFLTIINRVKYGKDAIKNTSDILAQTDIPVLLLQGNADVSVPLKNSTAGKVKEKSNIKVIIYPERNHNLYQTKESEKYLSDTFGEINKVKKEYKGKIPQEKIDELYGSIDYKKMTEEDETVMKMIIEFISQNMS